MRVGGSWSAYDNDLSMEQHVDTNKGVMEMQATKQLVLDGLKRLQQPDEPEWLQQLKAMPEEEEEPIKVKPIHCPWSRIHLMCRF